ncbi:MAG: hypothetical protein ACI9OJ_001036 [Myxococcota bacterium]|jgi:hypothetical protein
MIGGLLATLVMSQGPSFVGQTAVINVDIQGAVGAPADSDDYAPLLVVTLEEGVVALALSRLILPALDKPGDPGELVLLTDDSSEPFAKLVLVSADTRSGARYELVDAPIELPTRRFAVAAPISSAWARLAAHRKMSRKLELGLIRVEGQDAVRTSLRPLKRPRGDDPARQSNAVPETWSAAIAGISPGANPDQFVVASKHWVLDGDLIIPVGATLTVEPGTTLSLCAACSIFSYGRLVLNGTPENPVAIRPSGKGPWGTIAFLGPGASDSMIRHTLLHRGSQASAGIEDLNGCVTARGGTLTIEDSRFVGNLGEDAIHMDSGRLNVRRTSFVSIASDGIDLVRSTGEITDCQFKDIGDDAIDAGQRSTVTVRGVLVERAGGKALSVGQDSHVTIADSFLLASGRGISSFEGSTVRAEHVAIAFSRRGGVQASARKGTTAGTVAMRKSLLWQNGSDTTVRSNLITVHESRTDFPIDLATYRQPTAGDGIQIGPPQPQAALPIIDRADPGDGEAFFGERSREAHNQTRSTTILLVLVLGTALGLALLLGLERRLRV